MKRPHCPIGGELTMYMKEREIIRDTCLHMQSIGYFLNTWGNISMRVGDHIVLTPSRVNYNEMVPEDLVVIDLDGNIIEGSRNPTSEKEVHRNIYVRRPDVKAVIHAHSPKAMACSVLEIPYVPCMVEEMSQLLKGHIPLTEEYVEASEHARLGRTAGAAIGESNGLLLRNHGSVGCGRDMAEAIVAVKVIEKACGIYLDITPEKKMRLIPEEGIKAGIDFYMNKYGRDKT